MNADAARRIMLLIWLTVVVELVYVFILWAHAGFPVPSP